MIYSIRQGQDIFDLNPGLHAVREFSILTSQQMTFVCLMCDPSHDNPVGTLAGRARREAAVRIAGYNLEKDGKRLDKNARMVVYGQIPSIEKAIAIFQELHYNERHKSIEATKQQIHEIQEFLVSEKRNPVMADGKILTNADGEELYTVDIQAMKLAFDAAGRLPELHTALEKLQEKNKTVDTSFQGETFSGADIMPDEEDEGEEDNISEIEQYVQKTSSLNDSQREIRRR